MPSLISYGRQEQNYVFMTETRIGQYAQGLVNLFYPALCVACAGDLVSGEEAVCMTCLYEIPRTEDELHPLENPLAKVFRGRINITAAASCFLFSKGGKVQELIHNLKYNGRKDAGIVTGKIFGEELKDLTPFNSAEVIIPVPLHYKKLRKRGYNQAACFAEGIADVMKIQLMENAVMRIDATETQTRKSREERWENVEDVFVVKNEKALEGKHILLVDDVITTGATIEACATPLLAIKDVKVSILSMASARD